MKSKNKFLSKFNEIFGDNFVEFKKDDCFKEIPNDYGVYAFSVIKKSGEEVVYIGKAGTLEKNGCFKKQTLKKRIRNKHGGMSGADFLEMIKKQQKAKSVVIHYSKTCEVDKNNKLMTGRIPAGIEADLLSLFFSFFRELPCYNLTF